MINIAELLKDAPEGMILYSPLFGEIKFKYINGSKFGIVVEDSEECFRSFDKYGRYFTIYNNAECLLFPSKDCRTWKGWKLPVEPNFKVGDWITDGTCKVKITDINNTYYWYAKNCILGEIESIDKEYHLWTIQDAKDGDVLATDNGWTCIFKAFDGCVFSSYCFMDSQKWFYEFGSEAHTLDSRINGNIHPATQRQRNILFKKMQEAGYQWYAGKKELRKVKFHYDIANFYAGMPVLVRETSLNAWQYVLFSHCYIGGDGLTRFNAGLVGFTQCIPYNDDTKHLLGTTDMPDECYINW